MDWIVPASRSVIFCYRTSSLRSSERSRYTNLAGPFDSMRAQRAQMPARPLIAILGKVLVDPQGCPARRLAVSDSASGRQVSEQA